MRLKPFLDANYAPLSNRHQYWFGVTLIIKAIVLILSATAPVNSAHVVVFSVAITAVVLTFWGQMVYRNRVISLLHTSLFMNLAVLNITKLFMFDSLGKNSITSFTLIAVPLAIFIGTALMKLYKFGLHQCLFKSCLKSRRNVYELRQCEDMLLENREHGNDSESDEENSCSTESLESY